MLWLAFHEIPVSHCPSPHNCPRSHLLTRFCCCIFRGHRTCVCLGELPTRCVVWQGKGCTQDTGCRSAFCWAEQKWWWVEGNVISLGFLTGERDMDVNQMAVKMWMQDILSSSYPPKRHVCWGVMSILKGYSLQLIPLLKRIKPLQVLGTKGLWFSIQRGMHSDWLVVLKGFMPSLNTYSC